MKKSEYEAARKEAWAVKVSSERSWSQCVRDDVAAAEAAGVTWDAEEEPMAERLGLLGGALWAAREDGAALREATVTELHCAADLYNRRHVFERIAQEMTALRDRLHQRGAFHFRAEAEAVADWIAHLRSPIQ